MNIELNRRQPAEHGFALVVTIAVLAFLVLLLTSLAALVRVESDAAQNALRLNEARRHALLGLDVALGQLQTFAGPDRRVTATAPAGVSGAHYTGVWDAQDTSAGPLTWLVSGNEGEDSLAVTPSRSEPSDVEMVGEKTAGTARSVVAPPQPVRSRLVAGQATAQVGRFAWWVGDQGVKAPLTNRDLTSAVTYVPFSGTEARERLWQQFGRGPAPSTLEPRDANNRNLVARIFTQEQLAFLKIPAGEPLGLETARNHFHDWSPGNFAVLAATSVGGLKADLSQQPERLGAAFAAWADSTTYMEDPRDPSAPLPLPAYPAGSPLEGIRRRYRFRPSVSGGGFAHGVAPVLNHFLLTFNLRTDQSVSGATRPLEVRARWMVSLWNPYTSAFVPEDLQLEVTGLPSVQVINDTAGGTTVMTVPLDAVFGSPLRIALPWQNLGRADQQSWLPGRVYSWTSLELLNKTVAPPSNGFASDFYVKNFNVAGQGVQRVAGAEVMSNTAQAHLVVATPSTLRLTLFHLVGGAPEMLAAYESPSYQAFSTTPSAANAASYQFSFYFRLAESIDTVTDPGLWLTTAGQDVRDTALSSACYIPGPNGNRPELYPNFASSSFPDRLLDRSFPVSPASATGQSYNEDTPLFEFPRGPILSLGSLQHAHTSGTRPFAIGNSWGAASGWNGLYDRFFFSGMTPEVELPAIVNGMALPNSLLNVLPTKASGGATTLDDLRSLDAPGFSSRHLVQGGAFNLNSTSEEAWLCELRRGRFAGGASFSALNALTNSGTASDTNRFSLVLPGATFFRFAHSAQETMHADAGYAASTTAPPTGPNVASLAATHLFRRGVRKLSDAQSSAFAAAIVNHQRLRREASGPFRSMEEFLNPSPLFVNASGAQVSLLEKAIEDAGLNAGISEFSSQWLTQADVMTALAPTSFVRSDTFVIRSYGESQNPITGTSEARAWLEAVVQRRPDYVDATQPAETPPAALNEINARFGRRFQIVSFRWLTTSDL